MWFLAFFVAGLFGLGVARPIPPKKRQKMAMPTKVVSPPPSSPSAASASEPTAPLSSQAEGEHLLGTLLLEALGDESSDEAADDGVAEGGKGAMSDDEDAKAVHKKVAEFDWNEYKAAWGSTPLHVAVTALFAEYALVVGRITGHLHHQCNEPMTDQAAEELGEMCSNFVLRYVNPILGVFTSTKVHKLLCHIVSAIKLHGALSNGNTGRNESLHVQEKSRYCRTNGDPDALGYQMLRAGQGTIELRAKHAIEEEQEWLDAEGEQWGSEDDSGEDEPKGEMGVDGAGGDWSGVRRPTRSSVTSVSDLSARPGLELLAETLQVATETAVHVTGSLPIHARFECCGVRSKQSVRATPSFRGGPWYDHIAFEVPDCPNRMFYGQARAVLHSVGGRERRVVIVSLLKPCESEPGCPLVARGCTRLAWDMEPADEWPTLRAVPFSSVRRLLHVVPDMDWLAVHRGMEASPSPFGRSAGERRAARFFVNAFYPWL